MTPDISEWTEYRIVLLAQGSQDVFVLSQHGAPRLIRVTIPSRTRVTRELCLALRNSWGVRALVLEYLHTTTACSCAIAEILVNNGTLRLRGTSTDQLPESELSAEERLALTSYLSRADGNPVARLGWLDQAFRWVAHATGAELLAKGSVEQYNAGGGFSLLRMQAQNGSDYWLKATGFPNSSEREITRLLCQQCPEALPVWLGERADWNAWLTKDTARGIERVPSEPLEAERVLGAVVDSLASIQIMTAGMEEDLSGAGAWDQRLPALRSAAPSLFEYVARAMMHQTSTKAPRLTAKRLDELCGLLVRACDHAESLDVPTTILHGDMNLGNVVFENDRCQILDWAETYLGYPLISLQHVLLLNPIEEPAVRHSVNVSLKQRYLSKVGCAFDCGLIEQGFDTMDVLAAASAMYGRGDWLQHGQARENNRFGYVRRIARHMDAAAREPAFLRAVCC